MAAADTRAVECHQQRGLMEHGCCRFLDTADSLNHLHQPDDTKGYEMTSKYLVYLDKS